MFSLYILKSLKNESYYVGSCKNLDLRFNLHNSGKAQSTKRYIPWKIAYKEGFRTLSRARKREIQIKSWKSKIAIERLIKNFKI